MPYHINENDLADKIANQSLKFLHTENLCRTLIVISCYPHKTNTLIQSGIWIGDAWQDWKVRER